MKLYGLYNPAGKLFDVSEDAWDLKSTAFVQHDDRFQIKFWHRAVAAWRAAQREGWKIVPGRFVKKKEEGRG